MTWRGTVQHDSTSLITDFKCPPANADAILGIRSAFADANLDSSAMEKIRDVVHAEHISIKLDAEFALPASVPKRANANVHLPVVIWQRIFDLSRRALGDLHQRFMTLGIISISQDEESQLGMSHLEADCSAGTDHRRAESGSRNSIPSFLGNVLRLFEALFEVFGFALGAFLGFVAGLLLRLHLLEGFLRELVLAIGSVASNQEDCRSKIRRSDGDFSPFDVTAILNC